MIPNAQRQAIKDKLEAAFFAAMARNGAPPDNRTQSHGVKIRDTMVAGGSWGLNLLLDGWFRWTIYGKHDGDSLWPTEFIQVTKEGVPKCEPQAVTSFDQVATRVKLDVLEES